MSTPAFQFSHMGMFVADLARMQDFYTRVLGFTVTDSGDLDTARGRLQFVLLSRDPKDHHQIVLATGRPSELAFNPINQISFRMADFSGLREMYRRLVKEQVKEMHPASHGNALSVYFHDPEGNRIELFVDTPSYVKQPLRALVRPTLVGEAAAPPADGHAPLRRRALGLGRARGEEAARLPAGRGVARGGRAPHGSLIGDSHHLKLVTVTISADQRDGVDLDQIVRRGHLRHLDHGRGGWR